MTFNMAFSGLSENVVLNNIIPNTDGTIGCVKGDPWCPSVGPYLPVFLV